MHKNTAYLSLLVMILMGIYACDDETTQTTQRTCGEGTILSDDGKSCEAEVMAGVEVTAGESTIACGEGTILDEETSTCTPVNSTGGTEATIACGEGTILDENTNTCILDDGSRVIIDGFNIGEFEFSQVDVPEQLDGLEPDQRTFTIKNVGEEDQELVFVSVSISPVENTIQELRDRIDSNDISDDNPFERYRVSSVFIENLGVGESREIDYEVLLPDSIEDGTYGLVFAVNEYSFIQNADGEFVPNYADESMHEVQFSDERLDDAALVHAASTVIVGHVDIPNLRILESRLGENSFTVPSDEDQIKENHERLVASLSLSSQGIDYTGSLSITASLKLPGYEINPRHLNNIPEDLLNNPDFDGMIEDATENDEELYVYNPERTIPLHFVLEDESTTSAFQIEPSCKIIEGEEVCTTIQNDNKREVLLSLGLLSQDQDLLRQTLNFPNLNQDLSEFGEIEGEIIIVVNGTLDEYNDNIEDNVTTLPITFMAPELEGLSENAASTTTELKKWFTFQPEIPIPNLSPVASRSGSSLKAEFRLQSDVFSGTSVPLNYQPYADVGVGINLLSTNMNLINLSIDGMLGFGDPRDLRIDNEDVSDHNQRMDFDLELLGFTLVHIDSASCSEDYFSIPPLVNDAIDIAATGQTSDPTDELDCNIFNISTDLELDGGSPDDLDDGRGELRRSNASSSLDSPSSRSNELKKRARALKAAFEEELPPYRFSILGWPLSIELGAGGSTGAVLGLVTEFYNFRPTSPTAERPRSRVYIQAGPTVSFGVSVDLNLFDIGLAAAGIGGSATLVENSTSLKVGTELTLNVASNLEGGECVTGYNFKPFMGIFLDFAFLSANVYAFIKYWCWFDTCRSEKEIMSWGGLSKEIPYWTIANQLMRKLTLNDSNDTPVCLEERDDYVGTGYVGCDPNKTEFTGGANGACNVQGAPFTQAHGAQTDGEENWGTSASSSNRNRLTVTDHEIYTTESTCTEFTITYDSGRDTKEPVAENRNYFMISAVDVVCNDFFCSTTRLGWGHFWPLPINDPTGQLPPPIRQWDESYTVTGLYGYNVMYANRDLTWREYTLISYGGDRCIRDNNQCIWWGRYWWSFVDRRALAEKLLNSDYVNYSGWQERVAQNRMRWRILRTWYERLYAYYVDPNYGTDLNSAIIQTAAWIEDRPHLHPSFTDELQTIGGWRFGWTGTGEGRYKFISAVGQKLMLEAIVNKKPARKIRAKVEWHPLDPAACSFANNR